MEFFIATCRNCNAMVAVCKDRSEWAAETGKDVVQWIKHGLLVEYHQQENWPIMSKCQCGRCYECHEKL